MITEQLAPRGVGDHRVLRAMRVTPREECVPTELRPFAFADDPLPIGMGQTISQPFVVGFMCEAARIRPSDRVLEVGAGCGYAAAVLAQLASHVDTVERIESLANAARRRLSRLGYRNVRVHPAGSTFGLPRLAPFDAVLVAAAARSPPPELLAQLSPGGRLVIPVGSTERNQTMLRITRVSEGVRSERLGSFSFVPLIPWQSGTDAG